MRRFSSRAPLSTLAELNVTPLLDLAFVLLIIFMITTPLIENRMDLVVPTSGTAKPPTATSSEVRTIEVIRSGDLRMEGRTYTATELQDTLAALKSANPDLAIVVRPDKELPVQRFIDVMDILKRVAISKVGVMTLPEEAAP